MGKHCMMFLGRFLACLLLAAIGAAQAGQKNPPITRDLAGAVGGDRGERVHVTAWHNDSSRLSINMMAEVFTNKDGVFTFAKLPWFEGPQWGFNRVVLVARSSTRVGIVEVRGDHAETKNVHIEMHKKINLQGQLLDRSSRKPITNGWIWPAIFKPGGANQARPSGQVWVTEPLLPWHAQTDAEGRFVLRGLPEGFRLQAIAGGEHHARTWVNIDDLSVPQKIEVPLGGRITGRVLLPDGKPAPRVQVETTSTEGGRGHTRTNDDGEYELISLGEGTYKVWAEVPDLTCIAAKELNVRAGEVLDHAKVQLVHGGFIVGRIVDATTGKAVEPGPQTDVAMYGPARGDGGSCECTPVLPDGTFRIRAPAGINRIYLRAAMGYNEPSEHVTVVEGQDTEVLWQLRRPKR